MRRIESALLVGAEAHNGDVRHVPPGFLFQAGLTQQEVSTCMAMIQLRNTDSALEVAKMIRSLGMED